jgi:hypothetical protein
MEKEKTKSMSITSRAWRDSWQWLLNTKLGWILAFVVGGAMGGIFVGNSILERGLAGLAGAIIGVILLLGIVFIIHLISTPSRLRKENRRKFIETNASYVPKIIGNPTKQKYTEILEILESIVKIENEVTDNVAGMHKFTNNEIKIIQKKFNQQTNISSLPLSEATKIYLAGHVHKKINEVISQLGLQIIGDTPTENQIEFLIKSRSVLDECDVGLSKRLKNSNEYTELLKKFTVKVPEISNDTPDWIILLLVVPSGVNSVYLLWSSLKPEYQKLFYKNSVSPAPSDFKSQRESGINELVNYAKNSIEKV